MNTVQEKYSRNTALSCRLRSIWKRRTAEPEYETIDEADLTEDDVVVERIHEEAKTEEKENENGEKEMVEVSPAKDKVKDSTNVRYRLTILHPLWTKHPNECTEEDYNEFLPQGIYGLQGAVVLDSSEHGLSVQPERYSVLPEDQYGV